VVDWAAWGGQSYAVQTQSGTGSLSSGTTPLMMCAPHRRQLPRVRACFGSLPHLYRHLPPLFTWRELCLANTQRNTFRLNTPSVNNTNNTRPLTPSWSSSTGNLCDRVHSIIQVTYSSHSCLCTNQACPGIPAIPLLRSANVQMWSACQRTSLRNGE
jgi:hypothetical protein